VNWLLLVTVLVLIGKLAVVEPAGTVTVAGTAATLLLLVSETTVPPGGATRFNKIDPVELAPPWMTSG
jgi:hypothetical protein